MPWLSCTINPTFRAVRRCFVLAPFVANIASLPSSVMTNISAAGVEPYSGLFSNFPTMKHCWARRSGTPLTVALSTMISNQPIAYWVNAIARFSIDWEVPPRSEIPHGMSVAFFADFLSAWLLSMPLGSRIGVNRVAQVAARPLSAARPTIRSFWEAYSSRRGLGGEGGPFVPRARPERTSLSRLSQSAYEMCQETMNLSATELYFMQTSWNIQKGTCRSTCAFAGSRSWPARTRWRTGLACTEELDTPR